MTTLYKLAMVALQVLPCTTASLNYVPRENENIVHLDDDYIEIDLLPTSSDANYSIFEKIRGL
jgi:hypothetical protein